MRTPALAVLGTFAALAAAVPGAVLASDIYKWTDDNGIVHFGDTPSGAASAQIIDLDSKPTDPAAVETRVQSRVAARNAAADAEAAALARQPTEEERRAEARQRVEKCTLYKNRLQKFVTSRRLYREDENGERVYLDEAESLAARAKVQEQVLEYCDA